MNFIPDTSVQLPGETTFISSTDFTNLSEWSKSGNNLYNTSLANVGIGTTATITYKLNVNGSLNTTSLYQAGTLINFANFATDSELTTGLGTKQDKINAYLLSIGSVSSLGFSSGTLTLVLPNNYSSLTINNLTTSTSFIYKGTELSTSFNAKQNIINSYTITGGTGGSLIFTIGTGNLTLAMPNNYTANMSLSNLITPTSFIYKGTELSTSLNAKQNTLTAATSLLGIGSAITELDYNKITLNKPSVFPPDVANIYIKSEVNQLITNTSNYSLNISNILKANIDANNTTTNTSIANTSNYALNISNIIIRDSSNFTLGTSNNLRTLINSNLANSSNYALNISNILKANIDANNTTTNTSIANTSNYSSNISNVLLVNYNSLNTTTNTNISNYASNISNVLLVNYNSLNTTTNTNISNYASNISNIINANFLKLSGGVMSGQITGVSTISATTGLFGQVATTNNTNVALPSLGVQGGVGDKIIIYAGTATIHPYSLGINTNSLWYSVPSGASHNFYNNGTNTLTINSSGNVLLNTTSIISGMKLDCRGTIYSHSLLIGDINTITANNNNITGNFQLIINPPTASAGASIQTIRQGTGFNQNLILQGTGGNVVIGSATTPSQIFGVGNYGRLRIANNNNDYSILGTIDTDGATNTRIVVSGNTRPSFGGNIDYVSTADGSHIFYTTNSTTERMRIANNGNVFINNGLLTINAADGTTGGTKGIIFRSGYNTPNSTNYNCSILTYDHDGNGFCDGLSINGWDGISFCTGANTRNERMRITANGNLILPADKWVYSSDSTRQRIYFGTNEQTYYQGYGTTNDFSINHEFRNHDGTKIMHLDKGGNMILKGVLNCQFITISNTSRDLTGIDIEGTNVGNSNNTTLFCIQGTFTGFHRVYTEDENFNIEDPQKFKNDYEGRIVVSTGKIATDTTDDNDNKENTEWRILYDKEGITVEDALPKIELSRIRKDKRVFGVLGDKRRTNNRAERLIVNSVGEGAVWCINSNGNIENGDYITSSDYLGYGEKQDEIFLCNYTVAKATMDCNFELDSPLYNCFEIDDLDANGNKLRVAFIASTYHCG